MFRVEQLKANLIGVQMNCITYYFSYSECIAFTCGHTLLCTDEKFTTTSTKHRNSLVGNKVFIRKEMFKKLLDMISPDAAITMDNTRVVWNKLFELIKNGVPDNVISDYLEEML